MTVAFRTTVWYSPPSPLGLLAGRMVVEHTCRVCLQLVPTHELIDHAQIHEPAGQDMSSPSSLGPTSTSS